MHRPSAGPRDRLRRYRVVVDGEERGKVGPGADLHVALDPGPHQVRARVDWVGSPEVTVETRTGETTTLHVGPAETIPGVRQMVSGDPYLHLVADPDDLPTPSLRPSRSWRLPLPLRVVRALVVFGALAVPQLRLLRAGDPLSLVFAVSSIAFAAWLAHGLVVQPDLDDRSSWSRRCWWWTGWLVVALVLVAAAVPQHRLGVWVPIYVGVPAVGVVLSLLLRRASTSGRT